MGTVPGVSLGFVLGCPWESSMTRSSPPTKVVEPLTPDPLAVHVLEIPPGLVEDCPLGPASPPVVNGLATTWPLGLSLLAAGQLGGDAPVLGHGWISAVEVTEPVGPVLPWVVTVAGPDRMR